MACSPNSLAFRPFRAIYGPTKASGPAARFFICGELLSIDTNAITQIIEPSLEALGYRVVRIVALAQRGVTLQIMVERLDDVGMTVDDCATVSRSVSALLDVSDPIAEAYTLEVSSPGIDRPLVRPEDYDRYAGFEARVELSAPHEGRKRFRGRILGRENGTVRIATEAGEAHLPFADITRAKLLLTDDLIAAHTAQTH